LIAVDDGGAGPGLELRFLSRAGDIDGDGRNPAEWWPAVAFDLNVHASMIRQARETESP